MKFTIGDKVLLKRTGEEGQVSALIDKVMIEVEVNGTSFPVYLDEIDHPYLKWFTEKKPEKKKPAPEVPMVEKIIEKKQRLARGIYLSYIPVFKTEFMEEIVDYLKVHLLNELPVEVKFFYEIKINQLSEFKLEGQVHDFGNIYLHNVPYSSMNDQPRFHWKFIDVTHKNMQTAEGILRIRPSKLFEEVNEVMHSGKPSFSYLLIDEFTIKPTTPQLPEKLAVDVTTHSYTEIITTKNLEPAKLELDLHFEQLFPGVTGLSTDAILKMQLGELERNIHLAIAHRQQRMIVIHGLGKGKLREEVHQFLKRVDAVSRFKNEWSGKYGFGATEVLFKY